MLGGLPSAGLRSAFANTDAFRFSQTFVKSTVSLGFWAKGRSQPNRGPAEPGDA